MTDGDSQSVELHLHIDLHSHQHIIITQAWRSILVTQTCMYTPSVLMHISWHFMANICVLCRKVKRPSIHQTDNSLCSEKQFSALLDLLSAKRDMMTSLQFHINFNNDILQLEYTLRNNVVSGYSLSASNMCNHKLIIFHIIVQFIWHCYSDPLFSKCVLGILSESGRELTWNVRRERWGLTGNKEPQLDLNQGFLHHMVCIPKPSATSVIFKFSYKRISFCFVRP